MARKKSRSAKTAAPRPPAPAAPRNETAVAARAVVHGVTASPGAMLPAPARAKQVKVDQRFLLERVAIRIARSLGSLQVAVVLLWLFIASLAVGTMMESWYSAKVSQQLVYRSWWFVLLLLGLAVNIFFAAIKKWPWKKYQAGFLITHIGLIMMLAGGVLNGLFGTDASIALVDTPNSGVQAEYGPQIASEMIDTDSSLLYIQRTNKEGKKEPPITYDFDPGAFTWHRDEYSQPKMGILVSFLAKLSHPLPRSWESDVNEWGKDYSLRLEVLNSYPTARRERFGPAERGEDAFPAVKVQLTSDRAGKLPEEWLAATPRNGGRDQLKRKGAGLVSIVGRCSAAMIDEFLNPPPPAQVGQKGTLAVRVGGKTQRFNVADCLGGDARPIGNSQWKVKITKYEPHFRGEPDAPAVLPAVEFSVISEDGKTYDYAALARFTREPIPRNKESEKFTGVDAWFHSPDYRWGQEGEIRAVLDFVTSDDGKLYYRSFSSKHGFQLESSGLATVDVPQSIWQGMNWEFKVLSFIPNAASRVNYVPEDHRPGLEREEDLIPVLRCRLTMVKGGQKQATEFWVPKGTRGGVPVMLGREEFEVGYNTKSKDLGFTLKLLRAEQKVDPGTQSPATYTSFVQLTDKKNGINGEDRVITMNEPLEYNGYKLYQSGYLFLGPDDSGKPVSRSVLTVGYDPGILWRFGALKYTGSIMLALGIATMFYYRKAYFLRLRSKLGMPADAGPQMT